MNKETKQGHKRLSIDLWNHQARCRTWLNEVIFLSTTKRDYKQKLTGWNVSCGGKTTHLLCEERGEYQ